MRSYLLECMDPKHTVVFINNALIYYIFATNVGGYPPVFMPMDLTSSLGAQLHQALQQTTSILGQLVKWTGTIATAVKFSYLVTESIINELIFFSVVSSVSERTAATTETSTTACSGSISTNDLYVVNLPYWSQNNYSNFCGWRRNLCKCNWIMDFCELNK